MGDGTWAPARKSLGQHFLVDPGTIRRIVEGAGIPAGATVVEIGPGRGALTASLQAKAERLVLIEKDDQLAPHWSRELRAADVLLHRDALLVEQEELPAGALVVVGNLPYYVAGRITMHVLERWPRAQDLCFMYQAEVAHRLVAGPGSRDYGALSVMVQIHVEAWLLFPVPPGAFRPPPKVHSAVVRMRRRAVPLHDGLDPARFSALVHGAFSVRRKTLRNALAHAGLADGGADRIDEATAAAGTSPRARPEDLAPGAWVRLARVLLR
jgi:16S rRNA (adenine1518-N6/adenine1519-N6)-dimethyltransferase